MARTEVELAQLMSDLTNGRTGRAAAVRLGEYAWRTCHKERGGIGLRADLGAIAARRGVNRIERLAMLRDSARLERASDGYRLFVRASDDPKRQNFSIAHEIGHTYFGNVAEEAAGRQRPTDSGSNPEEERRCDIFAASLLMPRRVFSEQFRQHAIAGPTRCVVELASGFDVSIDAAALRIDELRLLNGTPKMILIAIRDPGHDTWTIKHSAYDRRRYPRLRGEDLRTLGLAPGSEWVDELRLRRTVNRRVRVSVAVRRQQGDMPPFAPLPAVAQYLLVADTPRWKVLVGVEPAVDPWTMAVSNLGERPGSQRRL